MVVFGVAAIVAILSLTAIFLFSSLPDANAFNARVERIFVENDALTSNAEIKLLEILALSGTAFSETLTSYRIVIFVLLVFATALLIAALVFLVMLVALNRRMAQIERSGIQVSSLMISRDENTVYLNNMGFKLTAAAMETLSVLAEARMDDDVLSGAEIEAMISGRPEAGLRRGRRRHPDQAAARHARQPAGQRIAGQEHRPARLHAGHRQGRDRDALSALPPGRGGVPGETPLATRAGSTALFAVGRTDAIPT